MRYLFVIAALSCAGSSSVRIADGVDVTVYVTSEEGARHAHPLRVTEEQVRAALRKDGNLVDGQISSIAAACAQELGRMQPDQRLLVKSGAELALYAEPDTLVVGRLDSGNVISPTRYSIAAPPPSAEMMALPTTAAAPAAPEDGSRSRARALYASAIAHYNLNEIKEALEQFTLAYRLFPEPVLLFNIAQCHRRLKQNVQALEMYRAFRREAPDAPNRASVDRFIDELERAPK